MGGIHDILVMDAFDDFLQSWGDAHPPSLPFDAADVTGWQRRFRSALDELRGPVPDRAAPRVDVTESVDLDDHTRFSLRIAVSDLHDLPAFLLVPHDAGPGAARPGLLSLHGHSRYGIDSLAGVRTHPGEEAEDYGLRAVRDGYVVLAPAWWGWTGRDGHLGLVGERRDRCNVILMAAAMYGLTPLDLHLQDAIAALDALTDRPEVDPGRIGCLGNSTGGRMTMWLSVFDERVRACVSAGSMNTFRERSSKLSSCGIQFFPGLLRHGDVPDVFCLMAPRPMQLQAGEGDGLITPVDRDDMEATVRSAYRALDAEDRLDYVLHAGGHLLEWDAAHRFFERWL